MIHRETSQIVIKEPCGYHWIEEGKIPLKLASVASGNTGSLLGCKIAWGNNLALPHLAVTGVAYREVTAAHAFTL